jgi:hypothetical protein
LAQNITGTLLKFSKGDWLAGKENRQITPGTRMVADMDSYSVGWIRWSNGKPTDPRMIRIVDRLKPAQRDDLGDQDCELWETDDKGAPRDPWQFTNNLVMADPETGEVFTFTTSSKGGRRALDKLCQAYGLERVRHRDEWPVVELGIDSYQHPNKAYGRIKEPILKISGWIPKDADSPAALDASTSTPAPAPKPAPAMIAAPLSDDMDEPPPYEAGDPGNDGPRF